jgi:hypothetical protein
MILEKLIQGLSQPQAAALFLNSMERGRTLTVQEAFLGWLVTLPTEVNSQVEAQMAFNRLKSISNPTEPLRQLTELFRQATVPALRNHKRKKRRGALSTLACSH